MIDESLSGRRVPPSEMEVAQDAVSVAYSLVQRHLASFGNLNVPGSNPPGGEQGPNAIAEVCLALARTLSTEALSREAAVSAGVTFSALGGVAASPAQHACAIADAFFGKHEGRHGRRFVFVARGQRLGLAPDRFGVLEVAGRNGKK